MEKEDIKITCEISERILKRLIRLQEHYIHDSKNESLTLMEVASRQLCFGICKSEGDIARTKQALKDAGIASS